MRLAVYDLDGTVLRTDSHALLLAALALRTDTPRAARSAIVTGALAWALGRIDDDATKVLAARALAGCTESDFRAWLRPRVTAVVRRGVRPAMAARLRVDRAEGFTTLLLSASLDVPVSMFADALGFDHCAGTALARDGERIGPTLAGQCLRGDAKARYLEDFAAPHGVDLRDVRGYGDRASDAALLARVGDAWAVHPDRALRRIAQARGWHIVDG